MTLILIDIPPDPAGMGLLPAVLLLILGFILLLAAALVIFLWYRKRGLRHIPMIRTDAPQPAPAHPSRPNQP